MLISYLFWANFKQEIYNFLSNSLEISLEISIY